MQPSGDSDAFRLHYVQGGERCVIAYDTIEAALEGARRRLEKHPEIQPWISDATRQVLLDFNQIRARLAGHAASEPPGGSPPAE
jgi:hypothetical protein